MGLRQRHHNSTGPGEPPHNTVEGVLAELTPGSGRCRFCRAAGTLEAGLTSKVPSPRPRSKSRRCPRTPATATPSSPDACLTAWTFSTTIFAALCSWMRPGSSPVLSTSGTYVYAFGRFDGVVVMVWSLPRYSIIGAGSVRPEVRRELVRFPGWAKMAAMRGQRSSRE